METTRQTTSHIQKIGGDVYVRFSRMFNFALIAKARMKSRMKSKKGKTK